LRNFFKKPGFQTGLLSLVRGGFSMGEFLSFPREEAADDALTRSITTTRATAPFRAPRNRKERAMRKLLLGLCAAAGMFLAVPDTSEAQWGRRGFYRGGAGYRGGWYGPRRVYRSPRVFIGVGPGIGYRSYGYRGGYGAARYGYGYPGSVYGGYAPGWYGSGYCW
jgi:hypothetical protein